MAKGASFFAVISDIHGNIDALDAVISDIGQWPVRGIFCLGDIVGYGTESAACVQKVMEVSAVSLIGNHEAMLFLAEQFPPEEFGASVGDPLALAYRQINDVQLRWLKSLPIVVEVQPITLCHASLDEPAAFHYIHVPEEAEANFASQTTFVSFHGHTHVPATWEKKIGKVSCFNPADTPVSLDEEGRYAINVGSVGQPRDGDTRSSYALYDYENHLLLHRRVEYDVNKAQARFKKTRLPAFNASRLGKGK